MEQPLPAGQDEALARIRRPLPSAPTKACMTAPRSSGLRERYDAVNIKLDKTGGLTEALAMADAAQALGFEIMVGCMVATSLSMAPAMLLAPQARFVDLDGPLLLARDREMDCATTAASSIRRNPRSGDELTAPKPAPRQPDHGRAGPPSRP